MTSLSERSAAVVMGTYAAPQIDIDHADGAIITATDGREYLDLLAGIAVNALGHNHPAIVAAVSKQVAQLSHVSNIYAHTTAVELAERLAAALRDEAGDALGADVAVKTFFCNSGAEANEAAFKIARRTGRSRIISFTGGFHGRTMGALALTGQPDKQAAFAPLAPGVEYATYNDLDSVTELVALNPSEVAAIILEPIQGEVGVIPAELDFLRGLRALCDTHGILLIIDEVQTGIGRTGRYFAHTAAGIRADVITLAKGLGGGLPLGATMATGAAADLLTAGDHGTTFGGNPICCAAGLAVLDTIEQTQLLQRVEDLGTRFTTELSTCDGVATVRGAGLILGVVLEAPVAKRVVSAGLDAGLLLNAPNEHVVRLTPPLILTDEQVTEAITTLAELIATASAEYSD